MKYRILITSFLSIIVLSFFITSFQKTTSRHTSFHQLEVFYQIKLVDFYRTLQNKKIFHTQFHIPLNPDLLTSEKPSEILYIAVIQYYSHKRSKALNTLLDYPEQNNNIIQFLEVIFKNENTILFDLPEQMVQQNFKDKWFQYYLLESYYKLVDNEKKSVQYKHKREAHILSYAIKIIIYVLALFVFFVLGIVLIYFWIKKFREDSLSEPQYKFSHLKYPVLEGLNIFLIWFVFHITISLTLFYISSIIGYRKHDILENYSLHITLISNSLTIIFTFLIIHKMILDRRFYGLKIWLKNLLAYKKGDLYIAFKGYLIAVPIVVIVSLLSGLIFRKNMVDANPIIKFIGGETTIGQVIMVFLLVSIMAPIFEEILFRGVIFRVFERKWGFLIGAIISSLLFGAAHLQLANLFTITSLGFILAWVYQRSGSLYSSVILHSIWNTISLITVKILF